MQDDKTAKDDKPLKTDGTREQRPGEAETTRFGMEEGDNIETPATGEGNRE